MHFQEGRESLEDDHCPGQPVSAWSNRNVEIMCCYVLLLNSVLCVTSLCVCVDKKSNVKILHECCVNFTANE